ncbi:MAG: hypothetical protein QNJ00_16375 [Woeseiaceae bacterium]|nr:hypothetical protein [Woeseiaceae bacterium]
MELTAGAAGRFADGLGKAEGEFSAEACHCEQLTTIYRELWDNDDCTDADVGIGLSVALPTYRDRVLPADTSSIRDKEMPILVLPLPGEAHLMSAVLAARSIESTGRRVEFRVPVSVDEMQVLVKQRRFAGVVMVTSTVFSRSSRRRFIESCGEALRNASESPLRVVLYGRIAEELCEDVVAGIDAAVPEAAQLAAEFEPKISRIH